MSVNGRTIDETIEVTERHLRLLLSEAVSEQIHGEVVVRVECHQAKGLGVVRGEKVRTTKPE